MDKSFAIAGIGELLFDVLPAGKQLGGAPVNFAFHTQKLGFEAYPVSAAGQDADGQEICDILTSARLSTKYIRQVAHPSGTAQVALDANGVPHFTITENVAWDHIQWSAELSALAQKVDAVCFGSLHSCETIRRFLNQTKDDCLRIFDINLRQQYYSRDINETSLQSASVLKLNENELKVLQDLFELPQSLEKALCALRDRYELEYLALTRGAQGGVLMNQETRCDCPGSAAMVIYGRSWRFVYGCIGVWYCASCFGLGNRSGRHRPNRPGTFRNSKMA